MSKGILPQLVYLLQERGGDFVNPVVVASDIAQNKDVENGHKHSVGRLAYDVVTDLVEAECAPDDCSNCNADSLAEILKFPSRQRANSVGNSAVKQLATDVVLVLLKVHKRQKNAPDNSGGHKQNSAFVQGQADVGDEASHKQDGGYRHYIP